MPDALLNAGAGWMIQQTKFGDWSIPDPAATITEITRTAGAAIGTVTALLLVAFVVQRRRKGLGCQRTRSDLVKADAPYDNSTFAFRGLTR